MGINKKLYLSVAAAAVIESLNKKGKKDVSNQKGKRPTKSKK